MKFSTTALALGMAALTWGKAVQNVAPHRRNGHLAVNGANSVKGTEAQIAELSRLIGLNRGQGVEINFLWVNLGGGAATTVLGTASTVTVTQTVGGDATAPPAVITGDPAASAPPTATVAPGAGATHSVMVGGPQGLAFSPQELNPAIGDTVIFTFLSQNHTATQSTFDKPCEALEGGMDSGFQANPNNTVNPPPQVAMQVMVDTPLCKLSSSRLPSFCFSLTASSLTVKKNFQGSTAARATTAGAAWSSRSTRRPRRRTRSSRPTRSRRRATARAAPSRATRPPAATPTRPRPPRPIPPPPPPGPGLRRPPPPTRASSSATAASRPTGRASAPCSAASATSPTWPSRGEIALVGLVAPSPWRWSRLSPPSSGYKHHPLDGLVVC